MDSETINSERISKQERLDEIAKIIVLYAYILI